MRWMLGFVFTIALACPRVQAQEAHGSRLEDELRATQAARADTTQTLPMLTLGAGVVAVLVGLGVGSIAAAACDAQCDMPTWVGPTIIAGGALGSLGTVWWINTDRARTELDLRIARLQDDLRITRAQREPLPEAARAAVSWRFRF